VVAVIEQRDPAAKLDRLLGQLGGIERVGAQCGFPPLPDGLNLADPMGTMPQFAAAAKARAAGR